MADRFDPRLVPGSIADARGKAFAETARRAAAEPDFRKLLFERIDDVDSALLPFLIREFGLHKFVEPGMTEATIRRMLKGSFELHKEIGYIRGVRIGLALAGIRITRWTQWFKATPMGAPGTHRVRIALDEAVFPDEGFALTARFRRLVTRVVRHTTRASQDVGVEIASQSDPAVIRVGVGFSSRIRMRMRAEPRDRISAETGFFTGVGLHSTIRFRMGV